MSKELTPLEHLQFIREYEIDDDHHTLNYHYATRQSLDIIETELKRLVYLEERVDDLKKDKKELQAHNLMLLKWFKALKIIKEKNVDVGAIKICVNVHAYNDFKELTETKLVKREKLTQEEFDTVKEVFKNE